MLKRSVTMGAPLALLMSCASHGADEPEMAGEVRIAIVQVPMDVRCADIVVK